METHPPRAARAHYPRDSAHTTHKTGDTQHPTPRHSHSHAHTHYAHTRAHKYTCTRHIKHCSHADIHMRANTTHRDMCAYTQHTLLAHAHTHVHRPETCMHTHVRTETCMHTHTAHPVCTYTVHGLMAPPARSPPPSTNPGSGPREGAALCSFSSRARGASLSLPTAPPNPLLPRPCRATWESRGSPRQTVLRLSSPMLPARVPMDPPFSRDRRASRESRVCTAGLKFAGNVVYP